MISRELLELDYTNHKAATTDDAHDAYMSVWSAMARLRDGKPSADPPHRTGAFGRPSPR